MCFFPQRLSIEQIACVVGQVIDYSYLFTLAAEEIFSNGPQLEEYCEILHYLKQSVQNPS